MTHTLGDSDEPRPIYLWVACTLAALIAAWCVAHLACISRDGTHYVAFARQLAQDPVFYLRAHRSQPGYSATMLAVYSLLPSGWRADPVFAWQHVGQLIAAFGYVACVPQLFLLARRLFDRRIAAVTAGLAALWPGAAQLSGDVLSDMPHLAIFLAALLVFDAALRNPRVMTWAFAGALSGLAYLFRQEALSLPIAGVFLALVLAWRGTMSCRACVQATFALAVGFFIIVLPYILMTGELFHKKDPRDLLFGQHAAAAAALPLLKSSFAMLEGWSRSGRFVFSSLFVLYLVMRPFRAQPRARQLIGVVLLLHCIAVFLRGASFDVISSRYMLIPAALTLPWSAAALCGLLDRLRVDKRIAWPVAWIIIAAITLPYALKPISKENDYLRKAGETLRRVARPGDEILAEHRACQAIYYANLKWNQWPDQAWPLETILQRDAQTGARWYIHFDGERGDPKNDDAIINDILHNPRWPAATLAQIAGPPGKQVRIILLRP